MKIVIAKIQVDTSGDEYKPQQLKGVFLGFVDTDDFNKIQDLFKKFRDSQDNPEIVYDDYTYKLIDL